MQFMTQYSPHQTVVNYNAGGKGDQLLLGVLYMAVGESLIVLSGAAIKHVTTELPIVQVMFFRSFFGLLFLAPLVFHIGLVRLKTQKLRLHFLRSLLGMFAMFGMFYSFYALKLTEAVLLKATSPIMLVFIAWLVLKERLRWQAWCAVFLAFTGVVVIVDPAEFNPTIGLGFLAGISSAIIAAFAKTTVRRLGQTEGSDIIVFYFLLFGSLLTLPLLFVFWQPITPVQWAWLALVAVLSTAGQVGITKAFSVAQAGQVAMFTYLSMPVAGALGWFLWEERITLPLLIGTVIIVCAGALSVLGGRKAKL